MEPAAGELDKEQLIEQGVQLFNSQQFFEAHEAWEEVWLDSERAERDFYQGLIQVAAALVHLQRNEYPGLVKLLARSQRLLRGYAVGLEGIDLQSFLAAVSGLEQVVLALGPSGLDELKAPDLPRIQRAPPPGPSFVAGPDGPVL